MIKKLIINSTLLIFFSLFITSANAQNLEGLTEEMRDEILLKRVDERIEKFLKALKIIADKSSTEKQRSKHLKIANSFFSDGARIEVSKLNPDGVTYSVESLLAKDYFRRLSLLNYDRIDMELDRVETKMLRRSEDTIEEVFETNGYYEQVFRGYRNSSIIYEDYTLKDILIKIYHEESYGEDFWDIEFSYIKVVTTTKVND